MRGKQEGRILTHSTLPDAAAACRGARLRLLRDEVRWANQTLGFKIHCTSFSWLPSCSVPQQPQLRQAHAQARGGGWPQLRVVPRGHSRPLVYKVLRDMIWREVQAVPCMHTQCSRMRPSSSRSPDPVAAAAAVAAATSHSPSSSSSPSSCST